MESAFFRKAREYVEANHDRWYTLSAKHGLLKPDGPPIEPYEETMSGAPIKRKRSWSERVFKELEEEGLLVEGHRLVFHAGRDYDGELRPLLDDTPVAVETPTDGLRFGETFDWYNDRL